MHPNRSFAWDDEVAMRAAVENASFAHLFAMTSEGAMVAHAPLVVNGTGFRFHVARTNRIWCHLDGAQIVASVTLADGYVSPDWYENGANQVPTWNYVAIEIQGIARASGREELVGQLDRLAEVHEAKLDPKPHWTRAKIGSETMAAMLNAIEAFEICEGRLRGTRKLSQNKSVADRTGVIARLEARGDHLLARLMRT